MWIDCDTCRVRGAGCADCAVSALLGPPARVEMDTDELAALRALADGGLVPPLRMSPLPVMGSPPPTAVGAASATSRAEEPANGVADDFVDDLGDEWSEVTFWPTGLDPDRARTFGRLRERGSG